MCIRDSCWIACASSVQLSTSRGCRWSLHLYRTSWQRRDGRKPWNIHGTLHHLLQKISCPPQKLTYYLQRKWWRSRQLHGQTHHFLRAFICYFLLKEIVNQRLWVRGPRSKLQKFARSSSDISKSASKAGSISSSITISFKFDKILVSIGIFKPAKGPASQIQNKFL